MVTVTQVQRINYAWSCPKCGDGVESSKHPDRNERRKHPFSDKFGYMMFRWPTEQERKAGIEWLESDWDCLCWKCQRELADEYDDHVKR